MPDGSAQADRCVSESGREIELDAKQSTTTRRVFDGDRSAMRLSQPLNDAEPKSRSVRAAAILAPEAVEDEIVVSPEDAMPLRVQHAGIGRPRVSGWPLTVTSPR